jgi:hypothetical protein
MRRTRVPSRYVVFQFLPDPLTDERINIGVATLGPEGFYATFLRDWRRVRSFAGMDVRFLNEFADRVAGAADLPTLWTDTEAEVAHLFDKAPAAWINSIQVTRPRASLRPADKLIDDVARRFLRTSPRQRRGRDRRWIRAVAYETVLGALESAGFENAEDLVHTKGRKATLQGDIEAHQFDLAVRNDTVVTAALALSFERQSPHDLHRDYSSAAWAIEDVRRSAPEVPLAVVMLPPVKGTSKTYEQARYVFERLDARPVPNDQIDEWATEVAAAVKPNGHQAAQIPSDRP